MQFLTLQECADLLRVHPNSVRNWIKAGSLKARKIGSQYRIAKGDLLEYLGGDGGLGVDFPMPPASEAESSR